MDMKSVLWYAVLTCITAAYLTAMAGVRSAKAHDVSHHSRRMIVACTIVGLWLVAYVLKQAIFGRERFGGTPEEYWRLYVPLFSLHMVLAVTTIALGSYNLYMGLRKLRYGSVGAMAVRIFGAPEAADFGLGLGRTLQLVNILRDLDEDAARDRIYLPRDVLAAEGVADAPAATMIASPGFARTAARLAEEAAAGFARAEAELHHLDQRALLPARIMMWGYQRLFERLMAQIGRVHV